MVVQPSETTTYIRESTNGVCTAIDSAQVTVIPVNYLEVIPNPAEICTGGSIQLDATTPDVTGYTWMPATGLSCSDCPNPVASPAGTTPYIVEGEFMGCPVMGSVIVEVPSPVYLFPDPNICLGESLILNLSPDAGTTYTWTSTDPDFGTSNEVAPTVTPTVETTYYLTAESGGIPCVVEDSITVIVFPGETVSISPQDLTVCTGETIDFVANVSGANGDFFWIYGNETAEGPTLSLTLTETINIAVDYVYGDNCLATDNITVTVLDEDAPQIVFPEDTQLCLGESITLNLNPEDFVTYTWTSTDPDFGTSSEAAPTVTPSVTTTYTVQAENAPCEIVEQSIEVVVDDENIQIEPDMVVLCAGETATLSVSSELDESNVSWSTGETGGSIDITGPFNPAEPMVSAVYTYGDGCISTADAVVVENIDPFFVDLSTPDTANMNTFYVGENVTLNATASDPNLTLTYSWSENTSGMGATVTGNLAGEDNIFIVTITDENGCTASASEELTAEAVRAAVPTVFMPNDRNVENKTFKVFALGEEVINMQSFKVFNRWGQLVWEPTNPDIANGWDGNFKDTDTPAPSDVYVFVIELLFPGDIEPQVLQGEVTLIR